MDPASGNPPFYLFLLPLITALYSNSIAPPILNNFLINCVTFPHMTFWSETCMVTYWNLMKERWELSLTTRAEWWIHCSSCILWAIITMLEVMSCLAHKLCETFHTLRFHFLIELFFLGGGGILALFHSMYKTRPMKSTCGSSVVQWNWTIKYTVSCVECS